MFRIVDGRELFYQWDSDRQVAVDDPSIVEVHFCNRTDECSLVTEVVDGVANVPNIILQNSFDIRVYGYDGKATLHEKVFKVKARTRPADYVYTETEVKTFKALSEDLEEKIDKQLAEAEENIMDNLGESYISRRDFNEWELDFVGDLEQLYADKEYVSNNYYNKEETDALLANIEIPEGGNVDLSDYYTKEETDAAIYNSRDAYYIDFQDTPVGAENAIAATADMVEFAERYRASKNVCVYIKEDNTSGGISGWTTAVISGLSSNIILRQANIDPIRVAENSRTYYCFYYIKLVANEWVQYKELIGDFTITTKEYVDSLFANIATAEGGAY